MVMALCGLLGRPKPDEPALDQVPVRVSVESKVSWQDLPGVPRSNAPEVESRRVHTCKDKGLKKYGCTEGCPGLRSNRDRIEGPQQSLSAAG